MAKDSFVIYKSFYEPIKTLSDKQLGKLFRALFEYQINQSIDVDLDIQMAFGFFKNQMEIDENKYQKIVERNRKNGLKNIQRTKEETQSNPTNPVGSKKPSGGYNDNGNDNDNVNDNKENKFSMSDESDAKAAGQLDFKKIIDFFNKTTKCEFGEVKYPISEKRKGLIRARIKEHGKSNFAKVINLACESDFLRGHGEKAFKMTFDWMIAPSNFEKILTGNYKNRESGKNKNRETNQINTSETKHRDYSGGF